MVALTPDPSFKASLITEKNNRKVFSQCSVRTCLFIKRATFYLVFPANVDIYGFFFYLNSKGEKKVVLLCLHFFICFILRFLVFFSLK